MSLAFIVDAGIDRSVESVLRVRRRKAQNGLLPQISVSNQRFAPFAVALTTS